jgi:hypothetical protein
MAAPVIPIGSFFDGSNRLVWPADAPSSAGLGEKRSTADDAVLAVLTEVRSKGTASVAAATTARTALLNYTEPAMRLLQATTTPRVADATHLFFLSLYHSVGQSANLDTTPPLR